MNPGIAQNLAPQFSLSIPYLASFLACCTNPDSNIKQWKDLEKDHDSYLSLKPSSNFELLVNQFNNATSENSNGPEKIA